MGDSHTTRRRVCRESRTGAERTDAARRGIQTVVEGARCVGNREDARVRGAHRSRRVEAAWAGWPAAWRRRETRWCGPVCRAHEPTRFREVTDTMPEATQARSSTAPAPTSRQTRPAARAASCPSVGGRRSARLPEEGTPRKGKEKITPAACERSAACRVTP